MCINQMAEKVGGKITKRQGSHWTGKTGKMAKINSLQGKYREFENLLKFRENTWKNIFSMHVDA
jgi:hypothetical protein